MNKSINNQILKIILVIVSVIGTIQFFDYYYTGVKAFKKADYVTHQGVGLQMAILGIGWGIITVLCLVGLYIKSKNNDKLEQKAEEN